MTARSYLYSEDSALMGSFLSRVQSSGSFLEIGTGMGSNLKLVDARKMFQLIVGTDLLELFGAKKEHSRSVELIQTDRASCFRPNIFDLVVFNPPYVPTNEVSDITTDGGPGGVQVPITFLSDALNVLRPQGEIVMLLSSEDSIEEIEDFCHARNLEMRRIEEKRLFFESLFLYCITRSRKIEIAEE